MINILPANNNRLQWITNLDIYLFISVLYHFYAIKGIKDPLQLKLT
jgi:hypothetical protein